jgi:hypothetical protein
MVGRAYNPPSPSLQPLPFGLWRINRRARLSTFSLKRLIDPLDCSGSRMWGLGASSQPVFQLMYFRSIFGFYTRAYAQAGFRSKFEVGCSVFDVQYFSHCPLPTPHCLPPPKPDWTRPSGRLSGLFSRNTRILLSRGFHPPAGAGRRSRHLFRKIRSFHSG